MSGAPCIAFVVWRMNWYRLFAAIIDAALKRGWKVECWHDIGTPMPMRPFDVPSQDRLPIFRNGKPFIREFRGREALNKMIRARVVDVVIDILVPHECIADTQPGERSLCVCMEANVDWSYYIRSNKNVIATDLFALTTPFWLEQALVVMKENLKIPYSPALEKSIREKVRFIGWPQIDQVSLIDPIEVRTRLGIPHQQPVIVYLNWVDTRTVNARLALFTATTTMEKVRALTRHPNQFILWCKSLAEGGLDQVTGALSRFCQRNDAYLLLKERHRDLVWPCERHIVNRVVGDESYYPHSILEVMSIASLCIGYFSFGVREAVGSCVPYLALDVAGLNDYLSFGETSPSLYRRWSVADGFFNYPGVVWQLTEREILKDLPNKSLSCFRLDDSQREKYFRQYLGSPTEPNSELFLDEIAALIGRSCSDRAGLLNK